MFTLTSTHLRFICEATTRLCLEASTFRAGQNLRGALGQVMQRTYCTHPPLPRPLPYEGRGDRERSVPPSFLGEGSGERSMEGCPVCWLLAADEHPGQERRGYALVPPLAEPANGLATGERFEFGITLFGHALKFLPYFVLAVSEMGRLGVGPGRGQFALKSVRAENPLEHQRECLLAEGDQLVHTPTLTMTHADVCSHVEPALQRAERNGLQVTLHFQTPVRLIEQDHLAQAPLFDVFFARLLKRLDELDAQFGSDGNGAPRGAEAAQALHRQARGMWLQAQDTRWVEVWSGSRRRDAASPLSGIVGTATFRAPSRAILADLMPWLLWGQLTQVGKSTVKGNGIVLVG